MDIQIRRDDLRPETVGAILRDLPDWFGIEQAIEHYVEESRRLPSYVAEVDGEAIGLCLVEHHTEHASEIALMAVRRTYHRRGVGRALLETVESDVTASGRRILQVKTLGPSRPSREYDLTRAFYAALGFLALEEFDTDTLWPGNPCLVMVKPLTG